MLIMFAYELLLIIMIYSAIRKLEEYSGRYSVKVKYTARIMFKVIKCLTRKKHN